MKQALKPHLGWHGARLSFLALFLLALLKVKTVNLKKLALGFEGRVLVDSPYKRLQRFFVSVTNLSRWVKDKKSSFTV